MRIRCGSCHGAIWIELGERVTRLSSVTCPTCKKEYRVQFERDAHEVVERLAAEARQLVRETQIDLPSAYSVLLGIITLEEILALGDASSLPAPSAPGDASQPHAKALAYDPEFRAAVDEGLLTPMQAMQRGLRFKYAALLAKRHRLSEDLAFEVADNRISLLEALRRRGPDSSAPVDVVVSATTGKQGTGRRMVWVAGAVVGAVVVFLLVRSNVIEGSASARGTKVTRVLGADVLSDSWGRTLKVSAPDPKRVLAAYCASDSEHRYEPVEVIVSAGGSDRLGLLRRAGRSGELLSIVVREDRQGDRWVSGDGTAPLVPRTAPAGAARAVAPR